MVDLAQTTFAGQSANMLVLLAPATPSRTPPCNNPDGAPQWPPPPPPACRLQPFPYLQCRQLCCGVNTTVKHKLRNTTVNTTVQLEFTSDESIGGRGFVADYCCSVSYCRRRPAAASAGFVRGYSTAVFTAVLCNPDADSIPELPSRPPRPPPAERPVLPNTGRRQLQRRRRPLRGGGSALMKHF